MIIKTWGSFSWPLSQSDARLAAPMLYKATSLDYFPMYFVERFEVVFKEALHRFPQCDGGPLRFIGFIFSSGSYFYVYLFTRSF